MKPSVTRNKNYFPYILLFVQPVFMATNIIVARGGVEYVPPISLAFWRWLLCFVILLPFTFGYLNKNFRSYKEELPKLFILGFLIALAADTATLLKTPNPIAFDASA